VLTALPPRRFKNSRLETLVLFTFFFMLARPFFRTIRDAALKIGVVASA